MRIETIADSGDKTIEGKKKPLKKLIKKVEKKPLIKNLIKKNPTVVKGKIIKKVIQKKPLRTAIKKVQAKKPLTTAIKKVQAKKPLRTAIKKVQAKKPLRTALKKLPSLAKKTFQKVKTFTGMAPRTAYLALVRINFRGFATRINALNSDTKNKLFKKWLQLGGNRTALQKAVDAGKNKKPILGIKSTQNIGELTVAAALAAATPIIVIIAAFIGKDNASNSNTSTTDNNSFTTPEFNENVNVIKDKLLNSKLFNKPRNKNPDNLPDEQDEQAEKEPEVETKKDNTLMYLGIGAAALLLLNKK
jgi:hypothetical protein